MRQDKIDKLDELAAPNSYAVPSVKADETYMAYFREVCKRYNIDFAAADEDEREFVMRMTEKGFFPKRA